jgi:hypothetical protein
MAIQNMTIQDIAVLLQDTNTNQTAILRVSIRRAAKGRDTVFYRENTRLSKRDKGIESICYFFENYKSPLAWRHLDATTFCLFCEETA